MLEDDHSKWSLDVIQNCGISECIEQNPLEFECIALDIAQTRRQARRRDERSWYIDVTGIPLRCNRCPKFSANKAPQYCSTCGSNGGRHHCSRCKRISGEEWPGYCDQCRTYERIKPLWSTEQ